MLTRTAARTSGLVFLAVVGTVQGAGPTGVKLDGTIGPSSAVIPGPTYNITQNLGQLSGGNLFFSFQYFNIATGQTALFTTTSAGIGNVISRVTGGYASTIDGTISLHAASGAPNFFLINPSGVTFTSNAVIDVPAAFYVSTANYLKFADGTRFYVDPSQTSSLSAAAPEAFGFLGSTRAPVDIMGATLSAGTGGAGDFQIAAGDVTVDGGGVLTGIENSTGDIRVSTVGSAVTEVPLTGSFTATDGTLTIRNGGELFTQGAGTEAGGAIDVSAGSLLIDGVNLTIQTGMRSLAGTNTDSGAIEVSVANDATIVNGGDIASTTAGAGNATGVIAHFGSVSIDGGTSTLFTGIGAQTDSGSSGSAGNVSVTVTGLASITDGGAITADTHGSGKAGEVTLQLGSLTIDGGTSTLFTGISSDADAGATGAAGDVTITVAGAASVISSGVISTNTYGPGNAGQVTAQFGSLMIDGGTLFLTGITSEALAGATGAGGDVSVTVTGNASVVNGAEILTNTQGPGKAGDISFSAQSLAISGQDNTKVITEISSDTYGAGNAGQVKMQLGSLTVNAGTSTEFAGISSEANPGATGAAGNVTINVAGSASVINGGEINTDTNGPGKAGAITLSAQNLTIDGGTSNSFTGVASEAGSGATGAAGNVTINVTGSTSLINGGGITTNTNGPGRAGNIDLIAQSLTISEGNSSSFTGIASEANPVATGASGDITINVAGSASVINGGEINTDTNGPGKAGAINLSAQNLTINGGTSSSFTGIASDAESGATGASGNVTINVAGSVSVLNGGEIGTDSYGPGKAGDISITAQSLTLNGESNNQEDTSISSDTYGAGNAGQVKLQVGLLNLNGGTSSEYVEISSEADSGATGAGGDVIINVAGGASILNGSEIITDTNGPGKAGDISLTAQSLTINPGNTGYFTGISSEADQGATGAAGNVIINVAGNASMLNGSEIITDTYGTGKGGDINLSAQSLTINGENSSTFTGISSEADQGATGAAGNVFITVTGTVTVLNGGEIGTDTYGTGKGGDISLTAQSLTINGENSGYFTGISSESNAGATGSAGNVTLTVTGLVDLLSSGAISIANAAIAPNPAAVTPTELTVAARAIELNDGVITAASTGNVAASAIDIDYTSSMRMLNSGTVSTSAVDGNGGPISVIGYGPLSIFGSNITTSVTGTTNGNGGNISVRTPEIVLDTGFIQANTAAPRASGGDVTIDSGAVIPSFESVLIGGENPITFSTTTPGLNVIQAAAPDGVSGLLNVTEPTLDLGNALLGLTGRPAAPVALVRSLCDYTQGSSLSSGGRGGLAPSADDPLWIELEPAKAPRTTLDVADPSGVHGTYTKPRTLKLADLIACL